MNKVLLVVVLVMGLTVLWFVSQSGSNADLDLPVEIAGEEDPGELLESSAPITAKSAVDASVARARVDGGDVEPYRSAESQEYRGIVLRVIDGADRTAAKGVAVWFLDYQYILDSVSTTTDRQGLLSDPVGLVRDVGIALRTDQDGRVQVPKFEKRAIVVGDDGQRRAVLYLSNEMSDPLLELWPNATLAIAVKDYQGNPVAGVPVALVSKRNKQWSTWWSGSTEGAQGLATLKNPRALALTRGRTQKSIGPCYAVIDLPFAERPILEFDLAALPEGPLELILPPTGEVEVVLEHPDDRALLAAEVRLGRVGFDQGVSPGRSEFTREAIDGRVLFERVGVGFDLRLRVDLAGSDETVTKVFDVPRPPGQRTVLQLSVASTVPVIVVKILNPEGKALGLTKLSAKMKASHGGSSSTSNFSVKTDTEGVLRLAQKDNLGDKAERHLTLYEDGEEVRSARLDIPMILRVGDNDLGTLTLLPPPVVCEGLVVDPDGEPVVGAKVRLLKSRQISPEFSFWEHADVPTEDSGTDGRFRIRGGTGSEAEMALTITCDGFLEKKEFLFAVGASNLRIVMDRAGSIAGSLVMKPGLPTKKLDISLWEGGDKDRIRGRLKGDGTFKFESLKPGMYSFSIAVFGLDRKLIEVEGLNVRSGEALRDPRLQDMAIASDLRALRFRVVNNLGAPIADTVAMIMPGSATAELAGGVFVEDGRGEVLATGEPIDLWIYAPGHRAVQVIDLRYDQTIVLDPALQVRFQIPADVMLAASPKYVFLRLKPSKEFELNGPGTVEIRGENRTSSFQGGHPWDGLTELKGKVDPSGRLVVRVIEPGEYKLTWLLGDTSHNTTAIAEGADSRLILVGDRAGEQLFDGQLTVAQVKGESQGAKK